MLAGCDTGRRSDTAHVQGTLTIGGEPLPSDAQANVTFVPAAKGRSAGAAVTDGKYDCPDAPLGNVKAIISVMRPTGKMITESDNRPYAEVGSIIANKYSSGVDVEITEDNTTLDFDLEPASM
jgi:hypothetical protein